MQRTSAALVLAALMAITPTASSAQEKKNDPQKNDEQTTSRSTRFTASFGVGEYGLGFTNRLPQQARGVPQHLAQTIFPTTLKLSGKKYSYSAAYARERLRIFGDGGVLRTSRHARNGEFFQPDGEEIAGIGGYRVRVGTNKAFTPARVKPVLFASWMHDRAENGTPFGRTNDRSTYYTGGIGALLGRYDGSFVQPTLGFGVQRMTMDRLLDPTDERTKETTRATKRYFTVGIDGRGTRGRYEGEFGVHTTFPIATSVRGAPLDTSVITNCRVSGTIWINPTSKYALGVGAEYLRSTGEDLLSTRTGVDFVHRFDTTSALQAHVRVKLQR